MSHSPEAELLLAKEIIDLDHRDKDHIPRGEVETPPDCRYKRAVEWWIDQAKKRYTGEIQDHGDLAGSNLLRDWGKYREKVGL